MISKKRNSKILRLIICLLVAAMASSLFLTVEPMASENANPAVVAAGQQADAEPEIFRAYSHGTPVTPLRLALQPLNVVQTANAADIETALASLPEVEPEEELIDPIEEDIEDEYYSDYEEDSYYEEDFEYEEDSEVIEEEESTYIPEEEPEVEEENNGEAIPEVSAPGSYSDLDYLAAICQIEAGYNYDGCLAVANVILNRVNAGFGSSIYDVIYAPYQFATGWMDYYLENGSSFTAYEAAAAALAGSNNIGGFLYFNGTTWLDPDTLDCPYVVIGGNVFY